MEKRERGGEREKSRESKDHHTHTHTHLGDDTRRAACELKVLQDVVAWHMHQPRLQQQEREQGRGERGSEQRRKETRGWTVKGNRSRKRHEEGGEGRVATTTTPLCSRISQGLRFAPHRTRAKTPQCRAATNPARVTQAGEW